MHDSIRIEVQRKLIERIRRELLALKADAIDRRIPCTTSDFTGIAARINEILELYNDGNGY